MADSEMTLRLGKVKKRTATITHKKGGNHVKKCKRLAFSIYIKIK